MTVKRIDTGRRTCKTCHRKFRRRKNETPYAFRKRRLCSHECRTENQKKKWDPNAQAKEGQPMSIRRIGRELGVNPTTIDRLLRGALQKLKVGLSA